MYDLDNTITDTTVVQDISAVKGSFSDKSYDSNSQLKPYLALSSSKVSLILDVIPELVIDYDTDMNIRWANRAALKEFNGGEEDIIGQKCYKAFWCQNQPCPGCPVSKVIQTVKPQEGEIHTYKGNVLFAKAYPLFDEDRFSGVLEIALDLTTEKQHQDHEKRQKASLHEFAQKMMLLTSRENEVAELIISGKANKQIARELEISIKTVEIHRSRVMNKLEVESLAELVRFYTLYKHF
jgi:DNA-binding CsgD family transcriptional regulator